MDGGASMGMGVERPLEEEDGRISFSPDLRSLGVRGRRLGLPYYTGSMAIAGAFESAIGFRDIAGLRQMRMEGSPGPGSQGVIAGAVRDIGGGRRHGAGGSRAISTTTRAPSFLSLFYPPSPASTSNLGARIGLWFGPISLGRLPESRDEAGAGIADSQ